MDWPGFFRHAAKVIWDALFRKKKPWRDAVKRGEEWDHIRNRPKDKR